MKKLILGIGNDILSDDGIGVKLVKHLENNHKTEGVSYFTAVVGGMELIELLEGFERAIVIDAIRSGKSEPGTVYHMTPSDFRETLHMSSFHDMTFLTALQFAKKMDIQLPEQIDIIAVEIVEDLLFSNDFSPAIAKSYEQIIDQVSKLVDELMCE